MASLKFQDFSFEKNKDSLRVWFLKIFYFDVAIENLGKFSVGGNSISFPGMEEPDARQLFAKILSHGFPRLVNSINGKPTVYVHKNSQIPLIGNISFGLVDRNTTLVELKPITGCNLCCMYCSVNEEMRSVDFVVEKDYLVQELRALIDIKACSGIEVHINSQGEPLYYSDLVALVNEISKFPEISEISIDTNATLLTKTLAQELLDAGLTRFNVSLNAIDAKLAKKIAGAAYKVENVKKVCEFLASKSKLLIAPVFLPSVNDPELPNLIEFAKQLKAPIGVQNFLSYRFGKNPLKPMDMDSFYDLLNLLQKEHDYKLILSESDFSIKKTKSLPKPFKKGMKIKATVVCPGRMPGEMIAASQGRTISVENCNKHGEVNVKITRDKHNIFYGELIK